MSENFLVLLCSGNDVSVTSFRGGQSGISIPFFPLLISAQFSAGMRDAGNLFPYSSPWLGLDA